MKFRFVVSPSVEGSKQIALPALTTVKKSPKNVALDLSTQVVPAGDKPVVPDALKDALKQVPAADKVTKPATYLSITQFYARRDPNKVPPRVLVAGYVHNYSFQDVKSAAYTIYQLDGAVWRPIKSGAFATLKPNKDGAISLSLPASNAAMSFKFEVKGSVEGSVRTALPKLDMIGVRYRCVDWQQALFAHANNANELIGQRARLFKAAIEQFGFEARITYFNEVGGHRQKVDYRLIDWQERTFDTRTAAISFHGSLPNGTTREIVQR